MRSSQEPQSFLPGPWRHEDFHSTMWRTAFPIREPRVGSRNPFISKPQPSPSLSSRLSTSKCRRHWGKYRSSWRRPSRRASWPTLKRNTQEEVSSRGPSGLDTGRWNTLPFCSFVHEYALSTYVPPTPHLPGPTGTALPLGSLQTDVNSHCGV